MSKSTSKLSKKLPLRKKILLIVLVVIIALVSIVAVAYSRYIYPTGKIMPDNYAVRSDRNGVPMGNFFLVKNGEKYIAVDAGADNDQAENGLRKLGIAADDVEAVFVTHSHWDHVGSLDLFYNAVIYTGNTESSDFPDMPHRIMSDGEIVVFSDISVQCLYTPGHTKDSVCYLVDGKYLFVGDLLVTTNDSPFEARYDKDLQLAYREEMLNLEGVEYVFTGHFGLFKDVRFFRWWY